jgi:hypothetical protein
MTKHYTFPLARDLILDHLREIGPATIQELIVETSKTRDAVRKAINKLHAEKRIFVKAWPYQGIQRSRQWALRTACQIDAVKPTPRDNFTHQLNYRQRNKALLKVKRSMRVAAGNPFAALAR